MSRHTTATPLGERRVAESRALLALLWIGYSRAEAEEALRAVAHAPQTIPCAHDQQDDGASPEDSDDEAHGNPPVP